MKTVFSCGDGWLNKEISRQASDLLRFGKKPTLKNPFLNALSVYCEKSILVGVLREEYIDSVLDDLR